MLAVTSEVAEDVVSIAPVRWSMCPAISPIAASISVMEVEVSWAVCASCSAWSLRPLPARLTCSTDSVVSVMAVFWRWVSWASVPPRSWSVSATSLTARMLCCVCETTPRRELVIRPKCEARSPISSSRSSKLRAERSPLATARAPSARAPSGRAI